MPHTDEKLGLRAGVDGSGVPVGFQWDVLRRFTDDGGAVLGETRISVPVSAEDLAAHISASLVAQAATIQADGVVRDALVAERDAALRASRLTEVERETLRVERDDARSAGAILRGERDALAEQLAALQSVPE